MFRISLLVCFPLIFGIAAKPHKPWNKLTDEAFQDTVMSVDTGAKMSWGEQVEPPEDMDETDFVIDPHMKIWKSPDGPAGEEHPLKAEEDLDDLHHPSLADLLEVQNLQAADVQVDPQREDASMAHYREPEVDRDDVDHPVFADVAPGEPERAWEADGYPAPPSSERRPEVRGAWPEPELDEDDLYHRDGRGPPAQVEQAELLRPEVVGEVRVHLQPEEDMDALYHRADPPRRLDDAEAAAPAAWPSGRRHSEPEEDLDGLYHQ